MGALYGVLYGLSTAVLLNVLRIDLNLQNENFESIFRKRSVQDNTLKTERLTTSYLRSFIIQFSPLVSVLSFCTSNWIRERKMRRKLVERMERELDVTNLIRS